MSRFMDALFAQQNAPRRPGRIVDHMVPIQHTSGGPWGNLARVSELPGCAGLALHGDLPPGVIAMVAPLSLRGELEGHLQLVPYWFGRYVGSNVRPNYGTIIQPPDGIVQLEPGEIHRPVDRAENVSVWVGAPYHTDHNLMGGHPPFPRALIKTWPNSEDVPNGGAIPYGRAPWYYVIYAYDVAPPAPYIPASNERYRYPNLSGAQSTHIWGVGSRYVRLSFQDNLATAVGVPALESSTYKLYWWDAAVGWVHNATDDLDALGRGAITADHESETYEIPPGVLGVSVVKVAGDAHYCILSAWG